MKTLTELFKLAFAPADPINECGVDFNAANPMNEEVRKALLENMGVGESASGVTVTVDRAMRLSAVFTCVRILAESVGIIPLHMYRPNSAGNGKERVRDHWLVKLLNRPNQFQTSQSFRETLTAHMVLRGAGYAFKNRGLGSSVVRELLPINPARVRTIMDERWNIRHIVQWPDGSEKTFTPDEVLHIPGISDDGVNGVSVLKAARDAMGLGVTLDQHAGATFKNGARIAGVLMHPGKLGDEGAQNVRESWDKQYSGVQNTGKTAVLEEGMKWVQSGMSSEDAQFLESRKFQVPDICRFFRVPPHMAYDLDKATFSNIEHQGSEFITYSLMSWLTRWEQCALLQLLSPAEAEQFFLEHKTEALLRGDLKARYEAYSQGIQNGILSPDEARAAENMNPRGDGAGARFWMPENMRFADEPREAKNAEQV